MARIGLKYFDIWSRQCAHTCGEGKKKPQTEKSGSSPQHRWLRLIIENFRPFWGQQNILWEIIARPSAPDGRWKQKHSLINLPAQWCRSPSTNIGTTKLEPNEKEKERNEEKNKEKEKIPAKRSKTRLHTTCISWLGNYDSKHTLLRSTLPNHWCTRPFAQCTIKKKSDEDNKKGWKNLRISCAISSLLLAYEKENASPTMSMFRNPALPCHPKCRREKHQWKEV